MAENGILDYQGMNQAIYRGATSNIIVDTQSMSIEIGAGNTSHTSNLHFECNHDANVASIKLNSNVTTEFSRSKKLIKYPRVALTSDAETGSGYQGYFVSSSSNYSATYTSYKAFNAKYGYSTGADIWYCLDYPVPEVYSGTDYAFNPSHGGTATPDLFTGAVQGEWLKIQLPDKIALDRYILTGPSGENEFPRDWTVYGSVNGTNWDLIDSQVSQIFGDGTGGGGTATGKIKTFQLDTPTNEYFYFAFVFTRGSVNRTQYVGVGEIELYGVPEYDPDAHGTDVVVKSVPNVPNTDWLEVYYDAKDLEDGAISSDVTDLSPNTNDGLVSGDPQVSNGAFVFDGSGDYFSSTVTTTTGAGNWPHSYSFWMKADTDASSSAHFVALGTEGGAGSGTSVIRFSGENILWYFWSNDVRFKASNLRGRWVHIVGTYDGGSVDTSRKIFINNDEAPISSSAGTIGPLNLTTTSTPFKVGSQLSNTNTFKGSIANVRLFNRALTTNDIHQLYAYQKEYFGHGDLSMTLKAGRLGIGTSEPRAALDVRGDVRGGCPVYFQAELTVNNFAAAEYNSATSGAVIIWDKLYENTGCYNPTTGLFTAPMTAVYKFGYSMRSSNSGLSDYWTYIQKNGVVTNSRSDTPGRIYSPNDYNTNFSSFIMDLRAGDTVGILLATGTNGSATISNSYGYFHGHYFSESRGQHHFWD